jgi:hypothetical protein
MRQRLLIFGAVVVVVLVLIAINAAAYVRIAPPPENENEPDRSSYNAGPTGTRALYDYLQESGQRVMRWQENPADLNTLQGAARPDVWVIVGATRKPFDDEEVQDILLWVERGGRLILIDRYPHQELLPKSGKWSVNLHPSPYFMAGGTSDEAAALTEGVKPALPAQPSVLVAGVEQVQPSRLASVIELRRESDTPSTTVQVTADDDEAEDEDVAENEPVLVVPSESGPTGPAQEPPPETVKLTPAPVVQLSQAGRPLLVDYPHGSGRVIVMSDPYVVSNAGITLADNLILAEDLVRTKGGLIAFDEFHQGRAISQNQLAAYFRGTPVLPILAQLALILIVVVWTRSRRFGRALPLVQPDRRSKLEYVASMAELQQRSRAYDLAIENIYLRTRRALARFAGVDAGAPRGEIAKRVASRTKLDEHQLEVVMRKCEDAIDGEPTNAKQAIALIARLREIEESLGLRFRQREAKQAREL